MAVIIGQATTVSFGDACVQQVSWNANPNVQRLYCLDGTFQAWKLSAKPSITVNLSIYSPGPTYDCSPSTECESFSGGDIECSVSPGVCGDSSITGIDGTFYVNSYSFSKEDASMPGQESWSLITWDSTIVDTGVIELVAVPTYVIRGTAEGQATDSTITGITFEQTTGTFTTGSVSAGQVGKADVITTGIVNTVGGGSTSAGDIGNGSVSIPIQPLYI